MLTLGQTKNESAKFSVTIQLRDKKGNPTGKTKSYHTDSAQDLAAFYERHQPRRPHKKNKVHINQLPKKDEADKLVAQIAEYAEKQQEARK